METMVGATNPQLSKQVAKAIAFIEMKVILLFKMRRSTCQQTRGISSILKNSIPKIFKFF